MTNWNRYAMRLSKCILLVVVLVLIAETLGILKVELRYFCGICSMSMMFTSTRAGNSSS